MRRMITEKDVEKLDSIKPSEIEKLGAMQDPRTATAGTVLTAVAGGKAEYKAIPSINIKRVDTFSINNPVKHLTNGTWVEAKLSSNTAINVTIRNLTADNETYIDLGMVSIQLVNRVDFHGVYIYFSPEAITKYSITTQMKFKFEYTMLYIA